ncbi:nucleotidyltransferase family protein [Microbulbifer agarilyticus]|uniref:nucleotidyltransferase family protein n=1 Tax=Microbulbifer agarilyticus TaxID=260552 RepID=UPI001C948F0A|nr:nucleotidyltransferase family protein [Microbulbifer agarilyticus]MBY6212021.1 nucleotidyltransferase family protein [Microbulbifer agarilyticus]
MKRASDKLLAEKLRPEKLRSEKLATVILAAGAASRFGTCKHLIQRDGKTVLQQRVESVRSAGLQAPLIVTGAWHQEIQLAHPDFDLHLNPNWQQGLGNSIAFAIGQLPEDTEAVLLLLGDQVAVRAEEIQALCQQWSEHQVLACAHYRGAPGVPAIFPRALFPQLLRLNGDKGAKALLNKHAGKMIPMASAAIDIDTPQDWQNWQRAQHTNNDYTNGEAVWN